MKKPYSLRAELRALRTICLEPDSRAGQYLLAKLNKDHFATGIGKATYNRVMRFVKKESYPPDWEDLITDPGLDQSVRNAIADCDTAPVSSKRPTAKLVVRLDEYRKQRMLIDVGKYLEAQFKSSEPMDTDQVIQEIQNKTSGMNRSTSFKMLTIGVGSNIEKRVDKLLEGTAITYYPTGFKGFDNPNRGFPVGALVMLAGPTGSGKSLILGQLANNMAQAGAKIAFVPLEMTNDETLQRDIARNANVSMTDLLDPKNRISKKQKAEIKRKMMEWDAKTKRRGGKISYIEFEDGVTAETVMSTVKAYGFDVIIIDYIGLLDGLDGDDQWKAMNRAAKYAKVWAKATGAVVILAAQLSEEGMLRHSKSMKDHCNFFWSWKVDENTKATGIIEIEQGKARQASDHSFLLKLNYPRMAVTDATQEDMDYRKQMKESKGKGKGGKEKSRRRWENEDDGDDDGWNKEDTASKKSSNDGYRANRSGGYGKKKPRERERVNL